MATSLFNARDKQIVERNPYLKLEQPEEEGSNIIDPYTLEKVVHAVLDAKKVPPVDINRTRINDCRWRVQNLLNIVDEEAWTKMVEAALRGMEKTINNSQPNGTWIPCEYETRLVHIGKDKEAFLELVVRFVDTANAPDMVYQDGRPALQVNVQTPSIDPSVLENISRRADGDPEMKAILAALVQQQAMMAEFMLRQNASAPLAKAPAVEPPVVEEEPMTVSETIAVDDDLPAPPVRKGGRKPKAVEPTADIDPAALDALASLPVEE